MVEAAPDHIARRLNELKDETVRDALTLAHALNTWKQAAGRGTPVDLAQQRLKRRDQILNCIQTTSQCPSNEKLDAKRANWNAELELLERTYRDDEEMIKKHTEQNPCLAKSDRGEALEQLVATRRKLLDPQGYVRCRVPVKNAPPRMKGDIDVIVVSATGLVIIIEVKSSLDQVIDDVPRLQSLVAYLSNEPCALDFLPEWARKLPIRAEYCVASPSMGTLAVNAALGELSHTESGRNKLINRDVTMDDIRQLRSFQACSEQYLRQMMLSPADVIAACPYPVGLL